MNVFEVYIIFSSSLQRFYVGQTENFENRINRHNSGMVKSTKIGVPWQPIVKFPVASKTDAILLEKKIKGRGASRYLEDQNIKFGM